MIKVWANQSAILFRKYLEMHSNINFWFIRRWHRLYIIRVNFTRLNKMYFSKKIIFFSWRSEFDKTSIILFLNFRYNTCIKFHEETIKHLYTCVKNLSSMSWKRHSKPTFTFYWISEELTENIMDLNENEE